MKMDDVDSCTGIVLDKRKVVIHSKSPKEKPFKCHVCNGGFNQKYQLTKHFQFIHREKTNNNKELFQIRTKPRKVPSDPLAVVKFEPEEFVFVDYFNRSALKVDGPIPALRVMIKRALEFLGADPKKYHGISFERIKRYVQRTFNVKTDCLNILNEMVQEGIVICSDVGMYSKNTLHQFWSSKTKGGSTYLVKVRNSDKENQDFERLMREILKTPVANNAIQNYVKNGRTNWSFALPPRIKTFLKKSVKNGTVVKSVEGCVLKYRLREKGGRNQGRVTKKNGNVLKIPLRNPVKSRKQLKTITCQVQLKEQNKCVDNVIPQESQTPILLPILNIQNVAVKIENETEEFVDVDQFGIDIKYEY